MNNETEKLEIDPDKIIHILLKHLMNQRNEIAYMKNKAGLNSNDNNIAERSIGRKKSDLSSTLLRKGINNDDINNTLLGSGINNDDLSNAKIGTGINNDDLSNPLKVKGINNGDISNPLKGIGINNDDLSNPNKRIATNNDDYTNPLKGIGINNDDNGNPYKRITVSNVVESLSALEGTANDVNWLYLFFEQGLIDALEEYIKNGNGQTTLYSFYADFEEAIADKNSLTDQLKQAIANLRLEDTHVLPVQIPADAASLSILQVALHGHLSISSKQNMHENVALELLFLHNTGTAKQTQLRQATDISVSGFSKHLPKLKQYGLIKELPSKNYALTDKSIHILLELFGVLKNK
jgi:hypothetical protein